MAETRRPCDIKGHCSTCTCEVVHAWAFPPGWSADDHLIEVVCSTCGATGWVEPATVPAVAALNSLLGIER